MLAKYTVYCIDDVIIIGCNIGVTTTGVVLLCKYYSQVSAICTSHVMHCHCIVVI